jgi:hypothetical protein
MHMCIFQGNSHRFTSQRKIPLLSSSGTAEGVSIKVLLSTAVLFSVTLCLLVCSAPTTFHTVSVDDISSVCVTYLK